MSGMSGFYLGFIFLLLLFFNGSLCKKHKVIVVQDKRPYIHFTSFGLDKGGKN